jgi:hypothetical protein
VSARTDEIGLAMFDSDSGFLRVVSKRAGELGWRYHRFGTAPTAEALARRRMNALVLDVASLAQELTA